MQGWRSETDTWSEAALPSPCHARQLCGHVQVMRACLLQLSGAHPARSTSQVFPAESGSFPLQPLTTSFL